MTSDDALRSKGKEVETKARKALIAQWRRTMSTYDTTVLVHGTDGVTYPLAPVAFLTEEGAQEVENLAAQAVSGIADAFAAYTRRDPSVLPPVVKALKNASTEVKSQVAAKIGKASDRIGDWQGIAKLTFEHNFLTPVQVTSVRQAALLTELSTAAEATRAILESSRADVMNIGDAAIAAFDKVQNPDTDVDWGQIALAVVGAVVAVAGAAVTGGASVGAAVLLAGVSSSVGVASTVATSVTVTGGTVETVVDSLYEAMQKVDEGMEAEEKLLAKSLHDGAQQVLDLVRADAAAHPSKVKLVPMRASLTDETRHMPEFRPPVV